VIDPPFTGADVNAFWIETWIAGAAAGTKGCTSAAQPERIDNEQARANRSRGRISIKRPLAWFLLCVELACRTFISVGRWCAYFVNGGRMLDKQSVTTRVPVASAQYAKRVTFDQITPQ
jgi:hypothetical protein